MDAAAALVETAGRFLFCLPETQTRISNMLDVSSPTAVTADAGSCLFNQPTIRADNSAHCLPGFLLRHDSTLTQAYLSRKCQCALEHARMLEQCAHRGGKHLSNSGLKERRFIA